MEGFTSASLAFEHALPFMKQTMFIIKVKKENLGGDIDYGFADINKYSVYAEREILFNPLNIFRVVKC